MVSVRSSKWIWAAALPATLCSAALVSGCDKREIPPPYKIGLYVQGVQDQIVQSITWKRIEGGEPVRTKGVFGVGNNCVDAAQSTGERWSEGKLHMDIDWEVVGETPWDHPLLPGKDFSRTWLSVVWDVTRVEGGATTNESFTSQDPATAPYFVNQFTSLPQSHEASYYGVAADEYLIKVTDLDLWNNLEDTALNQWPLTLNTSTDWVGVNSSAGQTVQLMTRHEPKKDDVWASTNGNYLYFNTGKDDVHVEGKTYKADRILIKTTGDADPTGSSVLSDCLHVGRSEFTTNQTGVSNDMVDLALLDTQCTGSFKHQVVGHEWWAKKALVRAQTRTYEVTINEWGYEWYAFDPTGTTCERFVSTRKDDPSAKLFVAYTVDELKTTFTATKLQKRGKKLRGPHEIEIDPANASDAGGEEEEAPTGTAR